MDCFEKNIRYLKKYYYELFDKMYGGLQETSKQPTIEIQSDYAVNGELILYLEKSEKVYRMNSGYDPIHEARIWADQFELNNLNHMIAMFGFGNGIFVRSLLEKMKEDDHLFIYEPSKEVFDHVMHEYDLTDILQSKNVLITIEGLNDYDFHNVLQYSLNLTNMYSLIRCEHPYYKEIFEESCVKFWKEIRDLLFHTQININTEVHHGPRLLINSFHNMKYLKESYILRDIAADFRTDIPAIIVAAGPSVKDCIEDLKKAKGRAYILAVDRVLDYLLDEGVEPDFVVTVDPVKPLKYFSRREDVNIPLLTELASNYEILEAHKGEKIFFSCSYYFRKMYDAVGKYQPFIMTGASVATVAFSICAYSGFQKIILVGQDLAYDGNITHAGGVTEDVTRDFDFMVEGIDGKEVCSRYDWKEFIRWYKDMMHIFPDIMVIDTKKKGAKIYGAVLMPLGEAIEKYGAKDDQKLLELYSKERKSFNEETYKKACDFFEESLGDLDKIKKKAIEALMLCDRQISAYTGNPQDNDYTISNYKKLTKINKFIEKRPVYDLVDNIITSMSADELSSIYKMTNVEQNDKIDTYQKSKKMYQATIDGVDYIKLKLKAAIDEIKCL